ADAAGGRVDHFEAGAVARSPHHAFRVGRHQLAMPVEDSSVRPNGDHGVVKRAAAETAVDLAHAAYDGQAMLACAVAERVQSAGGNVDVVLVQPGMDVARQC